ncbi:MAG: hypothetical protein AB8H80_23400 [Planctomycetota bacterium]
MRNRAAAALAESDSVDFDALIAVLSRTWSGSVPEQLQWSSAVGLDLEFADARRVVRQAADDLVRGGSQVDRLASPSAYRSADLCCPLHPHELVLFVVRSRNERRASVALKLDSPERAEAWLRLVEPERTELLDELKRPKQVDAIVAGLGRLGNKGRALLRELLLHGPPSVQRAVVRLQRVELVDCDEAVACVVGILATASVASDRGSATRLLVRCAQDVAAIAATALVRTESRIQRARLLALMVVLAERSGSAAATLADYFDDAKANRRYALYAVSCPDLDADVRARIAAKALAQVSHRDGITRSLAIDVLANCGDGVDHEMRATLQGLLSSPEYEDQPPRLIGCLRQLGALPADVSLASKVACLGMPTATTGLWLAIADEGRAGGEALLLPLLEGNYDVRVAPVRKRLQETAPRLLLGWLESKDDDVRKLALRALCAGGGTAVSTERLVEYLSVKPLAATAMDVLVERPDARRHASRVLDWILSHSANGLGERERVWVEKLAMPLALKYSLLTPVLKRGYGLSIVRGFDADLRRWLGTCEDLAVRDRFLAELCRISLQGAQEVRMVAAALATPERSRILAALRDGPSVPGELLAPLRAMFGQDEDRDVWLAQQVLWTHRERLAKATVPLRGAAPSKK